MCFLTRLLYQNMCMICVSRFKTLLFARIYLTSELCLLPIRNQLDLLTIIFMSIKLSSNIYIFGKSDTDIDSSKRSSAYINALKHKFRIKQHKPDTSSFTMTSLINISN